MLLGLGCGALIGRGMAAPAVTRDDEGFDDFDLPVVQTVTVQTGVFRAVCRGTLADQTVGFAVTFLAPWKEASGTDVPMLFGKAVLSRTGVESDAFVLALATLYGMAEDARPMLPEVDATAAALACDPLRIATDPCNFKLFFHRNDSERAAELYLNINVHRRTLQLVERDARFRRNVVRALTERR